MSYTPDEVQALLEHWEEYRHSPRLWILVRYADLTVALREMPPKEYQAVLLCGLLTMTVREAGLHLGVSKDTAARRYMKGLEWIANYLNGRDT